VPRFQFHLGINLRCYGNVVVEAASIEAALPLLTADYIGENIDITETTTDSGQDIAVIDVSDADTFEELAEWAGLELPSAYDPPTDPLRDAAPDMLTSLKLMLVQARSVLDTLSERGLEDVPEWVAAANAAEAIIAKAEGRANG